MSVFAASLLAGFLLSGLSPERIGQWQVLTPPTWSVQALDISSADALALYAGAKRDFQDAEGMWQSESAAFQSRDGGISWARLATAPPGADVVALAVDPFDATHLVGFTSGPNESRLYASRDGGATWSAAITFPYCHFPSVAFDRTLPGRAYAACQRVFRTDDLVTWTRLSLSAHDGSKLQATPEGAVYAVESDRVVRSSDHGDTWTPIAAAPQECPTIHAFAADPGKPGVLFVGVYQFGNIAFNQSFGCGGVYRSLDGGLTFEETLKDRFFTDIAIDPLDPSIVYASARGGGFFDPLGGVWRSQDGGSSWDYFGLTSVDQLALGTSGTVLYASGQTSGVARRVTKHPRVVAPR
jgi:hypothetical protein